MARRYSTGKGIVRKCDMNDPLIFKTNNSSVHQQSSRIRRIAYLDLQRAGVVQGESLRDVLSSFLEQCDVVGFAPVPEA